MKKTLALTLTAFLCGASAAFAEYTYIDAWTDNTTLETDGAIIFSSTEVADGLDPANANVIRDGFDNTGFSTDNLWDFRDRSGSNGSPAGIWAAGAGSNEDVERLVTTFTLPGAGVYEIVGFYWVSSNGTNTWDVEFQLGSAGTPAKYTGTGGNGSGTGFTAGTNLGGTTGIVSSGVKTDDGLTIDLFYASLGTWDTTVAGSLNVSVYVDAPSDLESDGRTWYDGVGYQVIPEPSTYAALLGVVALLAAHSRRRYMPRASK